MSRRHLSKEGGREAKQFPGRGNSTCGGREAEEKMFSVGIAGVAGEWPRSGCRGRRGLSHEEL